MLYVALLHYPVYNKEGNIVTTSVANMDLHDIARACRTYGVQNFFVINPLTEQRRLADEIMDHWRNGYGSFFNPSRRAAFELVQIRANLDEVREDIVRNNSCVPQIVVTGANLKDNFLTSAELRKKISNDDLPYLLIFGTGSGIAEDIIRLADYRLEPIKGIGDYNHLSVRSAVAIVLDRICRK